METPEYYYLSRKSAQYNIQYVYMLWKRQNMTFYYNQCQEMILDCWARIQPWIIYKTWCTHINVYPNGSCCQQANLKIEQLIFLPSRCWLRKYLILNIIMCWILSVLNLNWFYSNRLEPSSKITFIQVMSAKESLVYN